MADQNKNQNEVGGVWNKIATNNPELHYQFVRLNLKKILERVGTETETVSVSIFKNKHKKTENQPDGVVLLSNNYASPAVTASVPVKPVVATQPEIPTQTAKTVPETVPDTKPIEDDPF